MSDDILAQSLGLSPLPSATAPITYKGQVIDQTDVDVPEWYLQVFELRKQRVPWHEIASTVGKPLNECVAANSRLTKIYAIEAEMVDIARNEELALIDEQLRQLLTLQKLDFSNLKVYDRILSWSQHRAKIGGLYAPERVQAQVQVSSWEDQLKILDGSYTELLEEEVATEYTRQRKRKGKDRL